MDRPPPGRSHAVFTFRQLQFGSFPLSITKTPDMTRTRKYAAAGVAVRVLAAAAGRSAPNMRVVDRCSLGYRNSRRKRSRPLQGSSASRVRLTSHRRAAGRRGEEKNGKSVVEDVEAESPAEAAGVQAGTSSAIERRASCRGRGRIRDVLRGKLAEEQVALAWHAERKASRSQSHSLAASRPMSPNATRVMMGIQRRQSRQG